MTKPGFEYIDFVQPVQASQKNINKFNELENFLTTGGFIQACNLPMATKRRCYSVNHGGERWDNFRQRHAPAPPNCSASDRTHQSGDSGMTNTTTEATDTPSHPTGQLLSFNFNIQNEKPSSSAGSFKLSLPLREMESPFGGRSISFSF